MPKENKNRILYVFDYIWKNTDSEHYVTVADIIAHLESIGISANRKTVAADITQLTEYGFQIEVERSIQNRYRFEQRRFELSELKMLVDAVQASRFISATKSKKLIEKLASLASVHQSGELKRNLYVDKRMKMTREGVQYSIDTIYRAINQKKKIQFQYYYYTPSRKRELKHDGKFYTFSPYDMYWNDDSYYVIGYNEDRSAIYKFRVDRMCEPAIIEEKITPRPKGYNISKFSKQVFAMFDGKEYTVELECENELMNTIVDRFGENAKTKISDDKHFIVTVDISASPTFYGWLFIFAGRIRVLSPVEVIDEYKNLAEKVVLSARL
ncbi:MAG: WYL domain-containing protein [Eubacteriales bacterium]|nr:WYL domain-containing protein [Eubacteriales bacterium]